MLLLFFIFKLNGFGFFMFRFFLIFLLIPISVFSTVIEIEDFSKIPPYVRSESLVLFDIDETLIESEISLGSSTWRQTMRTIFEANPLPDYEFPYYDLLVIFVERQAPMKPLEPNIPLLIEEMKNQGAKTMSFTARSINEEHYHTPVHDQGEMIYQMLVHIGIDFDQEEPDWISKEYHRGILFSSHSDKGPFLADQLVHAKNPPQQVIFVDDKRENAKSVDLQMESLGIPCLSFWYRYSVLYSKKDFDLLTSAVQLDYLFKNGAILSEREAKAIAESMDGADAKEIILELIQENKQVLLDFYWSIVPPDFQRD